MDRMLGLLKHPKVTTFRARYGVSLVVAALCFGTLQLLDRRAGIISVDALAIADSGVRGALFSAMISICGLFLTVMLAVLAVVTGMGDDKPVVRLMKEQMHVYDELINRLVGPIVIVLAVGLASLVCLLLPSADAQVPNFDRGWFMSAMPSATLALGVGLFFQTASVGGLLARVLLFKQRGPTNDDSAAAAMERIEERKRRAAEERSPGNSAVMALR